MVNSNDNNHHLKSYLSFYFQHKHPGHAIMMNGEWGSGKTHYIKNYISSDLESEADNVLFISLNGMRSVSQIKEYFLSSMIPFVRLNPNGFLVKFFGFSRKKWFDNSDDLIDGLASLLSGDKIYIFDDVERYAGDYNELFGFFSSLVEVKGARVLLIANEKELIKNANEVDYDNKKEKFLGRSIDLLPDFEGAFEKFCRALHSPREMKAIEARSELIKVIYEQSESHNLRVLKQALIELSKVIAFFRDDWLDKRKSVDLFVASFLCIFIEYSLGNPSLSDLVGVKKKGDFDRFLEYEESAVFNDLEKKYAGVEFRPSIIRKSFWSDVVIKGLVSYEYVSSTLSKSPYFSDEGSEREWMILWKWSDFRKEVYMEALSRFELKFESRGFLELGEVFMACGVLLGMYKRPFGKFTVEEAFEECKSYLVDYFELRKKECMFSIHEINLYYGSSLRHIIGENYGHYGFLERDSAEFNDLLLFGDDLLVKSLDGVLPVRADELLEIMVTDPEDFYRKLCSSHPEHSSYFKVPVLSYIDISKFVSGLFELSGSDQTTVLNGISTRWSFYPEIAQSEKERFFKLHDSIEEVVVDYDCYQALVVRKKIKDHLSKHLMSEE